MPTHAHLMVRDSEEVHAGDVIAKIPRETTKTKDITATQRVPRAARRGTVPVSYTHLDVYKRQPLHSD